MEQDRQDPAEPSPGQLWHDVLVARALLKQARHRQAVRHESATGTDAARRELVRALDAYTLRLRTHGTPVPYRLRDELRLHSALLPPQDWPRTGTQRPLVDGLARRGTVG